MLWKKTSLYKTLMHPVNAWKRTNPYYFVLSLPWLLLHALIGIPLSMALDAWDAIDEAIVD